MVGIKTFEGSFSLFVANTFFSWASLFSLSFSSKLTEVEVLHDCVGEFIEFFLVNNTWVLGVNSLSSLLNPSPLLGGNGVIKGFSEFLNTDFDFIVG